VKRFLEFVLVALLAAPVAVFAEEASYTVKLMTPETALRAAQAGLMECRKLGYQVTIVVVDRSGQTQVMLRDRFAGAHTIDSATNKAWTAASFKSNTSSIAENTQSGKESSGIRHVPKVLAIGGGMTVEAGGSLYGAVGVSGAPNGDADDKCAHVAIRSIAEDLEL
jgi:uncharacterized protein GlcG (DUF336 family)